MAGSITEFGNIMHVLNIFISIASLLSGIYLQKHQSNEMKILPKNLRLFILYFCFVCGGLLSLNCVIHSTVSLLIAKQKFISYIGYPIVVLAQQLRISFFIIILERTVATMFLEKYSNQFSHKKFFAAAIIYSFFVQLPCSLPAFFWMVLTNSNPQLYYCICWTAFVIHAMTLIMFKILHYKNQKMYKRLAYQVTLNERRQIAENIKVLTSIWPGIVLFSIIAPLGPASTLIFSLITGGNGPIALFHITYHIPIILLLVYYKYYGNKENVEKPGIFVMSPLGAILPTHVTVENYFNGLQNQWKK